MRLNVPGCPDRCIIVIIDPRHSPSPIAYEGLPVQTTDFSRSSFDFPGRRSFQGYVANVSPEDLRTGRYTLDQWLASPIATKYAYEAYVVTNFADGSCVESIARQYSSPGAGYETRERDKHDCYRIMFSGPGVADTLTMRVLSKTQPLEEKELETMTAMSAIIRTTDHSLIEVMHDALVQDIVSGLDLQSSFQRLADLATVRGVECNVNRGLNPGYRMRSDEGA